MKNRCLVFLFISACKQPLTSTQAKQDFTQYSQYSQYLENADELNEAQKQLALSAAKSHYQELRYLFLNLRIPARLRNNPQQDSYCQIEFNKEIPEELPKLKEQGDIIDYLFQSVHDELQRCNQYLFFTTESFISAFDRTSSFLNAFGENASCNTASDCNVWNLSYFKLGSLIKTPFYLSSDLSDLVLARSFISRIGGLLRNIIDLRIVAIKKLGHEHPDFIENDNHDRLDVYVSGPEEKIICENNLCKL